MRYAPTNTTCTGVSHTPSCQKHFRFNPSRAPVRNIIAFRGEPSDPFARTFFPRREPRDPDHAAGNDNASASVPGYRYATADAVGFRVFAAFLPSPSARAVSRSERCRFLNIVIFLYTERCRITESKNAQKLLVVPKCQHSRSRTISGHGTLCRAGEFPFYFRRGARRAG